MNITVDLKRNPDIANLIADMSMGDKVKFFTSLRMKDENTAEFTVDRADECSEADKKEHYSDDEDESEEEAEVDGDMMRKHARMPAPGGSKNTPGGSAEQDRLAASISAQL